MTAAAATADTGPRGLAVSDLERISRFRSVGYGGAVSDALHARGVLDTILAGTFAPLQPGSVLAGRAITVKIQTKPGGMESVGPGAAEAASHPQARLMRAIADADDGSVVVFDCSGDDHSAHFGEMSCQLAYSHGCRGLLLAGYIRDTRHVSAMADFPVYCLGTRPNFYGGWTITDVNVPVYLPGLRTRYVEVRPGDFAFADSDGAQIIPRDLADEVLLAVEQTAAHENEVRAALAAGMSVEEVYATYGVL